MNRHRSLLSCRPNTRGLLLALLPALLAWAGICQRSLAIDDSITQAIWKMKYGVTDAQINSATWLAADDDSDGISNGAEIAAGTNPFDAGSSIKITAVTSDSTQIHLTFQTQNGKQYVAQSTTTPQNVGSWTSLVPAVQVNGDGTVKTLDAPRSGSNNFYRVLVQDMDTDIDGVSDWAEIVAGYNKNDPKTNGTLGDQAALTAAIATSNLVTVTVTKSNATQPTDSTTPPVDTGSITISRGGPLRFNSITVPLQKTGTAGEGTDYDALPSSITFGPNQTTTVLTINPKFNGIRRTNVTAIVKAMAGGGYSLGPANIGAVVINPGGVSDGTGLTGQYHNTSSSTYASQQAIFNAAAQMTRTDATIDFNGIASISTGNPCTITMNYPHGLTSGTPVWILGVSGGTFSPAINGIFTATVTGATTFTVPSNCTAVPSSLLVASVGGTNGITSVSTSGNPCTVTTKVPHNFGTNGTTVPVAINWLNGGTFSPGVNSTYTATVTGTSTFTIPISCTSSPSSSQLAVATVSGSKGVNGWGSTSGPTGMSSTATGGAWSVRWTGQVLPKYSDNYTFDVRSVGSAKLWVNGQLLVDRWATNTSSQEYTNSISLKAGTLYDIQIDYWTSVPSSGSTGNAEARLYWWSPNQTKQIVPQNRLFPAPATQGDKPTAITTTLAATGYVTVPFSMNVTSPIIGGSGTTYALATDSGPLPPGLSLASTGAITGTPTAAGTYNVAINAINAAGSTVTGSSVINFTIYPSGGITREKSLATTGNNPSQITIPPLTPTPTHDILAPPTTTVAVDDDDYAANTGERLRGYIVPPKTGNYYFWISANNTAELWISNDSEYVNKVRRAYVTTTTGNKVWNASPTQQSQWLSLVAGQKYYFEVLHNNGGSGIDDDYVALGWCQDDIGTVPSVSGSPNPTGLTPVIPNGGAALQGYPLSGTMPIYVFQPYDYPGVTPPSGSLYAGGLGPQGASTSKASGSANVSIDAAGSQGILHFSYQNLTTPRTAYHLHTDGFTDSLNNVHPDGEIIYDIDDVDKFHPELRTSDGGYIWNFGPVGSFPSAAMILEAFQSGKIYLNVHTVTYPNGEIRGNVIKIDGSQTAPDPSLYAEPSATDVASNAAHAARFLNQASFGASPADVAYLYSNGFLGWINDQLTKSPSHASDAVVANQTADINNPYPSTLFTDQWWKQSISAPDQLRQRLAFALSEIMVISWANDTGPLSRNGRILADYYDNLVDNVLPTAGVTDSGNFRGILKAVSLTPAMGLYLDMRGNQKGDDTIGRHPNENYGREIMQLFSVGLNRLWDDGKLVLESDASLIPTYAQPNILGMAALLTGWNYSQQLQSNGRLPTSFGPAADYLNPMVLVPLQHDLGAKLLLNNVVLPAATGTTPRVSIFSVAVSVSGNPCVVTTSTVHGLSPGDTVTIAGAGGSYSGGSINATFQVGTVPTTTSFTTIPAVNCTAAGGAAGTVTGAKVIQPGFVLSTSTPIPAVTGSQADNAGSTVPHPYDQYGLNELERAMDNILANDNVAPFICRELIQRFVTSQPSSGYLYRVVQKFKDNGSGVRGDMVAVIKQILLDGEARNSTAAYANPKFGKQREPMLRLTGAARAFPASGFTGHADQLSGVDSNKFRITTDTPSDFSSGFTISVDFHGNYSPPGQTLTPGNIPTSSTYSVSKTLGISSVTAATPGTAVGITAITPGSPTSNPCTVTTASPHGLNTGDPVTISGVTGGTFTGGLTAINNTLLVTVVDATNFTVAVACTVAPTSIQLTAAQEAPQFATVVTQVPHGLSVGNLVTISGVSTSGTFTPSINSTFTVLTVPDTSTFTVACKIGTVTSVASAQIAGGNTLDVPAKEMINVSYSEPANSNVLTVSTTGPQTDVAVPGTVVNIDGIAAGNPCVITSTATIADQSRVIIAGVTDGSFGSSINGTFTATVTGPSTFTVPVNCTDDATTGTVQKTIKSKVYLQFLTQTGAGGASLPASGIFDVTANVGSTFTVNTLDTPTSARAGNVIIPKIGTSYTPTTIPAGNPLSGTLGVRFNTNFNHNLSSAGGQHIWVDVPVVSKPLSDAEYVVLAAPVAPTTSWFMDEDHVLTSAQPFTTNGGVYPSPSGSNNGVTIWPLAPPQLGRTNLSITINQSAFNLGSTESTLTQSPLNAPTVFNFFLPDYEFPGVLSKNGVASPEFQLSTDSNVMNLTNSLTNMCVSSSGGNGNANGLFSFNNGGGQVVLDIGTYMTSGQTGNSGIPTLVDTLANLLIGGPLDDTPRTTIINFVASTTNFPMNSPTPTNAQMRDRVRAIIHLIITTAEYAVQK